ncbi:hypothetical protein [Kitasatospora sp. LaBMicrA B282]|uniref:hypothetical protein n=1 Tax=Kitasatospora sp. LaBMicrA B282 TaxID=3420949 RepID=UPI003D0EBD0B
MMRFWRISTRPTSRPTTADQANDRPDRRPGRIRLGGSALAVAGLLALAGTAAAATPGDLTWDHHHPDTISAQ